MDTEPSQNLSQKPQQVSTKSSGILKSGLITGSMTFISRVFGLVRDTIIGQVFGAQAATDAFVVAFRIPNLFRRLFAEGAFSQAFVPVFTEYRERGDLEALRDLANHVIGTLGGILLLITTLGVAAAPLIIVAFAPGFVDDPSRMEVAGDMLRLTFPYLLFISLVACAGGIFNSFKRFAVPAFTPVLLNICLIVAAIWLAPMLDRPIVALAWGAFVAGLVQLLFQIPFLIKLRVVSRPRWGWRHPGVARIRKLMLPAIFGSSVAQINLLLDTVIASFLAAGSVSWLYFSDRMVEFPLGVFGIALATVVLPHLSSHHSRDDQAAYSRTLDWALRLVLYIALPATLGLFLLAEPILATIFQYREFTAQDTLMAGYSLMAYTIGLPGFILVKILAAGFFSRQDTKTPVRIAVIALIVNAILNVIFVVPMVYLDFIAPHMGLALATACSAWLQAMMLLSRLGREGIYKISGGWMPRLFKAGFACLAMAGLILWLSPGQENWTDLSVFSRTGLLAGCIGLGATVYFLALFCFGVRRAEFVE